MSKLFAQAREMAAIHISDEIRSNDQESCEIQMEEITVNDQSILENDQNYESVDIENSNGLHGAQTPKV